MALVEVEVAHAVFDSLSLLRDVGRPEVELEKQWREQREQAVPISRTNLRPLGRRIDGAWGSMRGRLVAYGSLPEDNADRVRAMAIHDLLFADGLEFLRLAFTSKHAESELRIQMIDERELAKDLEYLVGERFLADLRATHLAYGDALGINKASPQVAATVVVADHLRALVDAISGYALQLLAVARHDPEQRGAVVSALAPIDDFRAAAGRRVVADDEEKVAAEPAANTSQPQPTGTE